MPPGSDGAVNIVTGISSTINVAKYNIDNKKIDLMKLDLEFIHPRPAKVAIKLRSPNGRDIFFDNISIPDVSTNDSGVVNSNASGIIISKTIDKYATGTKGTTGIPVYDEWYGENPNGTWKLTVYDRDTTGSGNKGFLKSWSIQFIQEGICGNNKIEGHSVVTRSSGSGLAKGSTEKTSSCRDCGIKTLPSEICDGNSVSCTTIDNVKYSGGTATCLSDCSGFDLSGCTLNTAIGYQKLEPAQATTDNLKKIYNYMHGYEFKTAFENDGICLTPSDGPVYDCSTSPCSGSTALIPAKSTGSITSTITVPNFYGKIEKVTASAKIRTRKGDTSSRNKIITLTHNGVSKSFTKSIPALTTEFIFNDTDLNIFKGTDGAGVWELSVKNNADLTPFSPQTTANISHNANGVFPYNINIYHAGGPLTVKTTNKGSPTAAKHIDLYMKEGSAPSAPLSSCTEANKCWKSTNSGNDEEISEDFPEGRYYISIYANSCTAATCKYDISTVFSPNGGTLESWNLQLTPTPLVGENYFCTKRENIAGDFWHSSALLVDNVFVAGSNSGFLSVFDANNGVEKKAVVPSTDMLLNHLSTNYATSKDKSKLYGPDITPKLIEGTNFSYIFTGFGRGGKGFVVFDKDPLIKENTNPIRIFESVANHDFLMSQPEYISWGETTSNIEDCNSCADYLVVSAGYNSSFDKNDNSPETSAAAPIKAGLKWYKIDKTITPPIQYDTSESNATDPYSSRLNNKAPIVAAPAFINSKIDAKTQYDYKYIQSKKKNVDTLYFVDLVGQLFYYNGVGSADTLLELPQPGNLGTIKNTEDLNVFGKPAVIIREKSDRESWVYIGTGDATRPITNISGNNVLGLRHLKGTVETKGKSSLSDFYNATSDKNFDTSNISKYRNSDINGICTLGTETGCPSKDPIGWYFTLPNNRSVVGDLLAYNDRIYFTVFDFDATANINSEECSVTVNPGKSYLYEVNAFSGRAMYNYQNDSLDDRVIKDLGGGKASQPVLAVTADGDAKIYVTKGDGGLEVIDIENYKVPVNPARILWWKVY